MDIAHPRDFELEAGRQHDVPPQGISSSRGHSISAISAAAVWLDSEPKSVANVVLG
jgi:hypothetical protein